MILSHYEHRLWGFQRRKVLKSILHCNWEIFISPGNSSVTRFNLFIQFFNQFKCQSFHYLQAFLCEKLDFKDLLCRDFATVLQIAVKIACYRNTRWRNSDFRFCQVGWIYHHTIGQILLETIKLSQLYWWSKFLNFIVCR